MYFDSFLVYCGLQESVRADCLACRDMLAKGSMCEPCVEARRNSACNAINMPNDKHTSAVAVLAAVVDADISATKTATRAGKEEDLQTSAAAEVCVKSAAPLPLCVTTN